MNEDMLYTPWELYHITLIEIVPMVIQEHKLQPIIDEKDVGGEHQVLVAAHLNTGILYNHFIVNSVNMWSGKKFNCNVLWYTAYLLSWLLCARSAPFLHLYRPFAKKVSPIFPLRYINASVMALLRVPDKYAMERGGWKTDQVMKKVYTHTFSDERERVDELIDSYFERKMQHKK